MAKTTKLTADEGIRLDTSVIIGVPPIEVFQFWRALENFPRFMSNVKEVRSVGDNRHFWRVSGPVGTEVTWTTSVTQVDNGRLIAWASDKDAEIENRGEVRFEAAEAGCRVHVKITYQPPAGIVGHAIATVFGMNPKQQMDSDLQRCKTLLEDGYAKRGSEVKVESQVRHDEASRRSVHS